MLSLQVRQVRAWGVLEIGWTDRAWPALIR
jgi:hypothetical protein